MIDMSDNQKNIAFCGEIKDGIHQLMVRVYYADTDFSGVVYHGRYLEFFERGRTEFLRLSDIHHHIMAEAGPNEAVAWIVRRMSLDFASPAKIDDILCVETTISHVSAARVKMQQKILRGDKLLVGAEVEAAIINANGRPRRLPIAWIERFQ
ncbi:tol-pal system-associated acyl-CoA thioesterase [Bartonella sp. HY038]|uniref:tol-pal system-associated acyl-CoA thioesterase n=1 Tax=Bartonella sp. HY038 TaxID=2759660 RepID=UPI0015FCD58F